jgi:Protein of unknown function (DUF2934)
MPRKVKETEKSKAPGDETALNGHAAKPAASKASSSRKRTASRKKSASKEATAQVSDEAIRTRAYFIAEYRERMSLPGDAHSDWLEARRQLLAELPKAGQDQTGS